MIGFIEGECRLCGKKNVLNEGVCASHTFEEGQAYLFGIADGDKDRAELMELKSRDVNRATAITVANEKVEELKAYAKGLQEGADGLRADRDAYKAQMEEVERILGISTFSSKPTFAHVADLKAERDELELTNNQLVIKGVSLSEKIFRDGFKIHDLEKERDELKARLDEATQALIVREQILSENVNCWELDSRLNPCTNA